MAKEKDVQDLCNYLEDHVQYERWMLGQTFQAMHVTPEGPAWNMVFEAFCLHARNLYDFLRHEGKRANTYRADDYVPGRTKPNAELEFNELDTFLFHMSAGRAHRLKLNLGRLQKLGEWLDAEWLNWANSLGTPYKEMVRKEPVCLPTAMDQGVTLASACSHVTSSTTGFN